jgi:hypothetical protein
MNDRIGDAAGSPSPRLAPSWSRVMALSIGIRSRSILNGTQTVPMQHSASDPGITPGFKLGDSSVVCHPRIKARPRQIGK